MAYLAPMTGLSTLNTFSITTYMMPGIVDSAMPVWSQPHCNKSPCQIEELTPYEQGQSCQCPVFCFKPLQERSQGDDVEKSVEEVQVDEREGIQAIYYACRRQRTAQPRYDGQEEEMDSRAVMPNSPGTSAPHFRISHTECRRKPNTHRAAIAAMIARVNSGSR
jgi:hypothetical protein